MKSARKRLLVIGCSTAAIASFLASSPNAHAYTFNTPSDWEVSLDTNTAYSLGIRADKLNGKIGNNPLFQNQEYKHPDVGDITNNRFDVSSELNVSYQGEYGGDVSVSGWKDFAYNGGVATNPNMYAAGVPYSALSSSPSGNYPSYTEHYYNLGAELGNAFLFWNTQLGQAPVSIKAGRFTEYWGTALFSGGQAISYGQEPLDFVKATNAPGSQVKDLFLPRTQLSVHIQVSPAWLLAFQYQFEWRSTSLPQGGTWLSFGDAFFNGPTTLEGSLNRGNDHNPPDVNGNLGAEAIYTPTWTDTTIGFYYRQFDDVTPYAAFTYKLSGSGPGAYPVDFHNTFAQHIHTYGLSLEHSIGPVAASVEGSIRTNTGLLTLPGETNPAGTDGTRGNLGNIVADALYGLTPTPFWQTGSVAAEVAYSHLLGITHGKQWYEGDRQNGCGSQIQGCATANEANINIVFDPQWLSVFPGVDIDAPISLGVGIWGNGQTLLTTGTGDQAGSFSYSAGVHAIIRQKYNLELLYSGYNSPTSGITHSPSGLAYYAGGDGAYFWNDQSRIILTLSTTF